MGFSHSQIPETTPGQILKLTGLEPIDDIYKELEIFVRKVDHIRTEVDLRFTDFIKSLGASKLWEIYSNLEEILKMYLLVLAINLKGETIRINYDQSIIPYIHVNAKVFPYNVRKVINDFEGYLHALKNAKENLNEVIRSEAIKNIKEIVLDESEGSQLSVDDISIRESRDNGRNSDRAVCIDRIKSHTLKIYKYSVRLLKSKNYTTPDMIAAIEIIDTNNKTIIKACESIEIYSGLEAKFLENLNTVYKETQGAQRKDKMIQQVAHAVHEKILSPSEIVKFFWPYPDR